MLAYGLPNGGVLAVTLLFLVGTGLGVRPLELSTHAARLGAKPVWFRRSVAEGIRPRVGVPMATRHLVLLCLHPLAATLGVELLNPP